MLASDDRCHTFQELWAKVNMVFTRNSGGENLMNIDQRRRIVGVEVEIECIRNTEKRLIIAACQRNRMNAATRK